MEQAQIDYQRIEQSIKYIAENFKERPSLDEIAEKVHLSPDHFQKMFSAWAGVSPKKFMQFLSIDFLREKIHEVKSIDQAADLAGLSSQSRVYDLFVKIEAMTPAEYRSMGKGLHIYYGIHWTPFGECLIAKTERGICALAFLSAESKEQELVLFKEKWSLASLEESQEKTQSIVQQIFHRNKEGELKLLVQGTNFQLKVWEALLNIPGGALTTYGDIAERISKPKAVRAVGTAVGKNPIAYLIPCHRVIRKEGKLGEYRWGSDRKKALIGWEMARQHD
ncbi:MAG: methylated-DNA--[protein]-cysteine S-methyltransferase [Bacteroidota bacterium]